MAFHKRWGHRRDDYLTPSGSIVESDPSPTASFLAQNTAKLTDALPSQSGIPLVASSVLDEVLSTSSASSSTTPTASSTSTSTSSGGQISLGAVVGACVAALLALVLSVLLAFYCSKRHKTAHATRTTTNASRRRSRLETWKRIDDATQSMKQRPLSGPLGAMFRRTNSNSSGEKSSEFYNRESVGTMQNFAKYHPGLAAEMASQGASSSKQDGPTKPPLALQLVGRSSDRTPVSWDGDTIGRDSFFSHQSSLHNSMSPIMMATERATPPAITTSHRWESAEVVHVDEDVLYNPFSDRSSSVKSVRGQNPFFSGRDQPVRRTLPAHENPFADENTPRDSSDAIQSLIAALEPPRDQRIASFQSSVYSGVTAEDGESAVSVAAFPYPPQADLR